MYLTKHIFLILSVPLIFAGCYDKDILKEETYNKNITYNSSWAVPIGEVELPIVDLLKNYEIGDPNDSALNDTLVDFVFEDLTFENPDVLDTTIFYDFALSNLNSNIEYIKDLVIRLNFYNSQPFEIHAYPRLLASEDINNSIFNFDHEIVIPAAPLSADGKVTGESVSLDNDFHFDSTQIQQLFNVNYISVDLVIYTNISTTLDVIELDTTNTINVQVAARFTAEKEFGF